METVELRTADNQLRLIFPGEELVVPRAILSRSAVIADVLTLLSEGTSNLICAPPGFLRSWVSFLLQGKQQFAKKIDVDGLVQALKGADFLQDNAAVNELSKLLANFCIPAQPPRKGPPTALLATGDTGTEAAPTADTGQLNEAHHNHQVFQALPAHLVVSVIQSSTAELEQAFESVPRSCHPEVLHAFFPDIAQQQSFELEGFLNVGHYAYFLAQSDVLCRNVFTAAAQLTHLKRLRLRFYCHTFPEYADEFKPIQHLMYQGVQNMTRLTCLELCVSEAVLAFPDIAPALTGLKRLRAASWGRNKQTQGLNVALCESLQHCTMLEFLDIAGSVADVRAAEESGAALATSLSHCSNFQDLEMCVHCADTAMDTISNGAFLRGVAQGCSAVSPPWSSARTRSSSPREAAAVYTSAHAELCEPVGASMHDHHARSFLPRLNSLKLNGPSISSTVEAEAVAAVLRSCSSLQHLQLENSMLEGKNKPSTQAAIVLASGFMCLRNLRTLHLHVHTRAKDNNGISDKAMTALSRAFACYSMLERLDFSGRVSAAGSASLTTSLSNLTSLTKLYLSRLQMKYREAVVLEDDAGAEDMHVDAADGHDLEHNHEDDAAEPTAVGSSAAAAEQGENSMLLDEPEHSQFANIFATPHAPLEATVAALQHYSTLRSLDLHNSCVGQNIGVCAALGRAISGHSLLEHLSLYDNSFAEESLAALLQNVRLGCLTYLNLYDFAFEDVATALSVVLPTFSSLKELRLGYIGLRVLDMGSHASAAFDAFSALHNLEKLSLCSCRIDDEEAGWLAMSLRSGSMKKLRDVDLSQNFHMRNKGVAKVARALAKVPTLEELKLCNVGATMRGIGTVAWALKRHKHLRVCWMMQEELDNDEAWKDALEAKRAKARSSSPWLLF